MAEQDKDRNLDNLLDSLLARYSDVQPRPGLETRVMAQLREQAGRKKSWKWSLSWMWAGAAATALVTLVFIIRLERPIKSPEPLHHSGPSVVQPPRAGISVTTAQQNGRTPQPHHQELAVAADTRPDVFPTPAPLSDQEKLLLRYLARTARHEIVAQSHPDEPVETAEPFLLQIQLPTRTEFNNSTR
jgi:hypothetical protein